MTRYSPDEFFPYLLSNEPRVRSAFHSRRLSSARYKRHLAQSELPGAWQ